MNDLAVENTELGKNTKKYWFTMCCLKGDQLRSLNLSSANKVATLCSEDLLCLLNCITETIQVTEGCILASPHLVYYENSIAEFTGSF